MILAYKCKRCEGVAENTVVGKTHLFKGESYLAEQFRQITHYLAEQFCQIDSTLFGGTPDSEKWCAIQWKVLDFINAGMQVHRYASK